MKRLICALFGHVPRIQWWYGSKQPQHTKTNGYRARKSGGASCVCARCGTEIAPYSDQPRHK